MVYVGFAEINELLARHGIAQPVVEGSGKRSASEGGRIASIHVWGDEDGARLSLTLQSVRFEAACPLDESHAMALVESFRESRLLPSEPSFERMLAHLLMKVSAMYFDSGAQTLTLDRVHLHAASYFVGPVTLTRGKALHVKPRLESDSHDRHAVFAFRHGSDQKFPR
jgi:hypothetical protein